MEILYGLLIFLIGVCVGITRMHSRIVEIVKEKGYYIIKDNIVASVKEIKIDETNK